jgi:hypothetical protein
VGISKKVLFFSKKRLTKQRKYAMIYLKKDAERFLPHKATHILIEARSSTAPCRDRTGSQKAAGL